MRYAAILVAAMVCGGCHRAPAADAHQEAASSAKPRASAAPAPPASAQVDAAPPLPPYLPDGCWSDVSLDAGAGPLLDTLAGRCAQGMQPAADKPLRKELARGEQAALSFKLDDADKCVRAIAAGGPGVVDVELSLVDGKGHVYGRDALEAPFAMVDEGGPVCLPAPGRYRVVVRMRRGAGHVAVQIYRAK